MRHFRRVLRQLHALQLDSVNVLVRAHYLPLFSRLGPYRREALDHWTNHGGELFEYWGHEASLLPVDLYPLLKFRMEGMRPWPRVQRLREELPGFIESVYRQVAAAGPLTVSDLEDPGKATGPWWGLSRGKVALEWLFATGALAAYRTPTFGRLYDIPARVIPAAFMEASPVDRPEAYRELLLRAAAAHGIATAADLADYYRLRVPAARPILDELVRSERLTAVEVEGWSQPAYLDPAAPHPRAAAGTALLSPFDSLVWTRERIQRLFGFRYRIEIYVPKANREHGYYVLPFLFKGELAARVDLKADRRRRRLLTQAAFVEDGHDRAAVAGALWSELATMAQWLGLDEVEIAPRGSLAAALRRASNR